MGLRNAKFFSISAFMFSNIVTLVFVASEAQAQSRPLPCATKLAGFGLVNLPAESVLQQISMGNPNGIRGHQDLYRDLRNNFFNWSSDQQLKVVRLLGKQAEANEGLAMSEAIDLMRALSDKISRERRTGLNAETSEKVLDELLVTMGRGPNRVESVLQDYNQFGLRIDLGYRVPTQ